MEKNVFRTIVLAGRERRESAQQLSTWGEKTGDDAISDVSDKLAVLLYEIGELDLWFSQNLEQYRLTLKAIRDVEDSLKEGYGIYLAAVIETLEKQTLLAKKACRLLNLIDDTPLQPGDEPHALYQISDSISIIRDAEDELGAWKPDFEKVQITKVSGVADKPNKKPTELDGVEVFELDGQGYFPSWKGE